MINIDMWHNDKIKAVEKINIFFNDLTGKYWGNCYINNKAIGDYTEDSIQEWLDDDTISICTCRSGRGAVWIITESHESAVYIDTLEPLSQEEITKEFL